MLDDKFLRSEKAGPGSRGLIPKQRPILHLLLLSRGQGEGSLMDATSRHQSITHHKKIKPSLPDLVAIVFVLDSNTFLNFTKLAWCTRTDEMMQKV